MGVLVWVLIATSLPGTICRLTTYYTRFPCESIVSFQTRPSNDLLAVASLPPAVYIPTAQTLSACGFVLPVFDSSALVLKGLPSPPHLASFSQRSP